MKVKLGERVQFRPTHAKDLLLTGIVGRIHKDEKTVDISSEPGNGSISRIYSAHVDDCQPCEQKATNAEEEKEEKEPAQEPSAQ